jgi:hypothetical protein
MKNSYYQEKKDYSAYREPKTDRQRKHWKKHGPNWDRYYRQETLQIMGYMALVFLLGMLAMVLLGMEFKACNRI